MRSLWTFFRRCAVVAVALCPIYWASPVFGDVAPCVSGNLAGIDGTTCDIGNLQFTFSGLGAANYSYDIATQNTTFGTAWTDSFFTFTVLSNGFELSGLRAAIDHRAEQWQRGGFCLFEL